jgi:hypothetical protein
MTRTTRHRSSVRGRSLCVTGVMLATRAREALRIPIEMAAVMRISEREDRKLRSLLQKLTVSGLLRGRTTPS